MSAVIDIPQGERARIRIFAVNLPADEVRALLDKAPKPDVARSLLAAPHLDARSTEIFPVRDLEGLGLAQYLIDGYAVPEASLSNDRIKIDNLDGYVLLLFSDSFAGAATRLAPGPDLTLIGSYSETLPDNRQRPVISPSAAPYSGALVTEPTPPPRGPAARMLLLLAATTAIGLLLWWLLR